MVASFQLPCYMIHDTLSLLIVYLSEHLRRYSGISVSGFDISGMHLFAVGLCSRQARVCVCFPYFLDDLGPGTIHPRLPPFPKSQQAPQVVQVSRPALCIRAGCDGGFFTQHSTCAWSETLMYIWGHLAWPGSCMYFNLLPNHYPHSCSVLFLDLTL